MLKLSRYLKKYSGMIVFAIVLMFGQAILDLNLPNMMSNIVNVGIQKSGIEEQAPRAIPADALSLMGMYMNEDEQALISKAYVPYEQLNEKEAKAAEKTFVNAKAENAFVLVATGEELNKTNLLMSQAGYAFTTMLQEIAQANGSVGFGEASETTAVFDLQTLEKLLPALLGQPAENFTAAMEKSKLTPEVMSSSVSAVLNKAFYTSLGVDTGKLQTNYIAKTGGIMLLLSLAVVICAVGAGYFFSRVGAGVARDLRQDVFAKVSSFNNVELDKFSTSSLITRTTNDVTQVQMMYTMGMRMLVYAPLMGIGGVIMALRKSTSLSWVIALAVLIIVVIMGLMLVFVMPKFKKMQTLVDRLNLVARENLSGLMVVRAFGAQSFQEERFDEANKELTANSVFVGRAMVLMFPIITLIMNCLSLMIIWLGSHQIAQSQMQVGDIMAFIQYAMQIVMAFLFIAVIFIMVPRAAVSAERIDEVLRTQNKVQDPKTPKTLENAKGVVKFENVSFRYSGAEEDVLHDISFVAKPGEITAFIGSTGSGKSTVINLIPRFYDVTKGSITIDDVDIKDITQHTLRENIGYVPQKGLLFSGTIASNLHYGDVNANKDVLRKAATVAQATEFIDTMEEGFESEINQGGTNVSGGQRQRISIARALVKKAPIYIFDDSFSALDFKTDAKLRAELKPYTKESTVMIVAQRVSSIMKADQIIVMNDGEIVGKGTHAQLLKTCSTYLEIAESQLTKEELA